LNRPVFTIIAGSNGCGKSTLIDAISLALGRTKMVRLLTEHDFTGSNPAAATRIKIVVTVTGFDSDDVDENDEWFRAGRAVPKWLDPDGQEHAAAGPGRTLCANVGYCARFDRDELEVVSLRYFHDDDDAIDPFVDEAGIVPVPPRLLAELGFFVLPARRDWDAVASFNSDLFRRTVSNLAGIPADEIIGQRDALRNPAVKIEDSPRLTALVTGLNERLARLAPNAPKFQLRVTAGDSEGVLQALLPHYAGQGGPALPAARHGAGLVSLQSLLLLLEVGRARMPVRDLLQLAPGAVVELDRLAGEPLDVLVNGVRIARGEVVVVDEETARYGVSLTEIVAEGLESHSLGFTPELDAFHHSGHGD